MHTSQRISRFYEDVEGMKLKFPVATIAEKTKKAKGYVSEVLRKIKEPSEDFLNTFYEKFSIGSETNKDMENYTLPVGDLKVTLKDYVALLNEKAQKAEKEKDRLFNIIEAYLKDIHSNSKEIVGDISTLTDEIQAEHRAMMDSIDVAAKQPIGTTSAAADTIEIASKQEHQSKGKQAPKAGKPG